MQNNNNDNHESIFELIKKMELKAVQHKVTNVVLVQTNEQLEECYGIDLIKSHKAGLL
ncbi:hypothetical protein ABC382_00705 [Lysinibacillus sp. 1P01SD]|uniref:hypothetical protein n=1 Tax=Lysinibacillus sp. 1P01SD TaxID=3132285 RepID=UPI0039A09D92